MNTVQRNYKDTVFRMIFREKKNLLALYNAVNGTDHGSEKDLEITTLENAVYMNMKNDISFVIYFSLNLYEHQSTVNPNMPVRNLFYVAKILQDLTKDMDLYSSRQIMIPMPHFVVFYNGTGQKPEKWGMKLSDAYQKPVSGKETAPQLELKVTVYNINHGKNQELMDACRILEEYSIYVEKVRRYARVLPLKEAVERSVDECIREGVLADFFRKNRAEAVEMSLYEYNEELHIKNEREIAFAEGWEQGVEQERDHTEQQKKRAEEAERQRKEAEREIVRLRAELEKAGRVI